MSSNQDILNFLSKLSKNNNRAWFENHKAEYKEFNTHFKEMIFEIAEGVGKFDNGVYAEPDFIKIFRIYRDIRFSKDKTPYKSNFGASIVHGGKKSINPVYYLHIQPDNKSFFGGGWVTDDSQLLYSVRKYISDHYDEFQSMINSNGIKKTFAMGDYMGKLKTAPKGFAKDDPALEIIKHKSFTLGADMLDEDVASDDFTKTVVKQFKKLHPFQAFFYKGLADINKRPGEYKRV